MFISRNFPTFRVLPTLALAITCVLPMVVCPTVLAQQNPIVLSGHTGRVNTVAWKPDGKHLASSSVDDTIRIWDLEAKKELQILRGHHGGDSGVTSVEWNADGSMLASYGSDKTLRIWDSTTGKERFSWGAAQGGGQFSWHPKGKLIAAFSLSHLLLGVWDATTGKQIRLWKLLHDEPRILAWKPDGKHLAIGDEAGHVTLFDPDQEKPVLDFEPQSLALYSLAWSPDGSLLASGGSEWTSKAQQDSRGVVTIWDPTKPKLVRKIPATQFSPNQVDWSPDGKTLVAVTAVPAAVVAFDVATGQSRWQFESRLGEDVLMHSWRSDGKAVLISTEDLWLVLDAKTQKVLWLAAPAVTYGLRWRPDGLAVAGLSRRVRETDVHVWVFPAEKKK